MQGVRQLFGIRNAKRCGAELPYLCLSKATNCEIQPRVRELDFVLPGQSQQEPQTVVLNDVVADETSR